MARPKVSRARSATSRDIVEDDGATSKVWESREKISGFDVCSTLTEDLTSTPIVDCYKTLLAYQIDRPAMRLDNFHGVDATERNVVPPTLPSQS